MSGPTCGRQTHDACIVGCIREPFHLGRCRCEHGITDGK